MNGLTVVAGAFSVTHMAKCLSETPVIKNKRSTMCFFSERKCGRWQQKPWKEVRILLLSENQKLSPCYR